MHKAAALKKLFTRVDDLEKQVARLEKLLGDFMVDSQREKTSAEPNHSAPVGVQLTSVTFEPKTTTTQPPPRTTTQPPRMAE